jgi:4-deoxy-L-threo-5-hexosulose-uronate ketol-isomerase
MEIRHQSSPKEVTGMNTEALRSNFLIETVFSPAAINLTYTHYDRMIIGGAQPTSETLTLANPEELRAEYFLERRELGIINVGGAGFVEADGVTLQLAKYEALYIGRGTKEVRFGSQNPDAPALFYLLSAPAHQSYPVRKMSQAEASPVRVGASETANDRTIYKYIHPDGILSCQLVMGLTIFETGSLWNTMPPHTHDRRMEAYLYFDVPDQHQVLHLMGQADETRHLWIKNHQAVISPTWSIHAGCGTASYAFIWGMAGENQSFTDMDFINIDQLR